MKTTLTSDTLNTLTAALKTEAKRLGFSDARITDTDLSRYTPDFEAWLAKAYHGEMHYMEKNKALRSNPRALLPEVLRIIVVRLPYLPKDTQPVKTLKQNHLGYISRYALGGDYHRFIRKKLEKLAAFMQAQIGPFGYRAFTDSAPILEKPLGEKAGLGWIGKNTLLLHPDDGSWFFLGELFTDLPLPLDPAVNYVGCQNCVACINICPTQAIVAPNQLDARRCISYLTIELRGSIPEDLRPLIGNRIYGCDDCQLICPWNRYAKASTEQQFAARHALANQPLTELFAWDEATFLAKTEGSAIRRIGYECWLRNIAVALGNASPSETIVAALKAREHDPSPLVQEHVAWALAKQRAIMSMSSHASLQKLTQKLNPNY